MKPIVSDKILRDAVEKELESDPEVAAKHISVTAIDGAITLGGHVMTDHEKHVAVRAAERVPAENAVRQLTGVRAVGNLIKVKPQPGPTAGDVERRVQEGIVRTAELMPSPSA